MIRLVATDLDGTFWDTELVPPPSHLAAVEALRSAGVTVVVATSRRPRVVARQLGAAGLALPAVLMDGALGLDLPSGACFHRACFGADDALATLATFRAHGLDPCLYVEHPEIDIVVSETPSTCAAHLTYLGAVAGRGDLQATAGTSDVYAFSVLGLGLERLRPVADELAGGRRSGAVLYPEPDYGQYGLIASPPGVTKWTGVDAYCRRHGIAPGEVLAVGDGLNDVAMLEQAGTAVAVRGGAPEAVAAAEHLIDPPAGEGWTRIVDLVHASRPD